MTGRKPKPIADLKAQGTYRRDRHDKATPQAKPVGTLPDCPDHLPESCRADWQRVVGLLHGLGILTTCDLDAVERFVFLLEMQRQAQAALSKDGPTVKLKTKHGEVHKKHPSFGVLLDCGRELRALSEKLGFDPLSRQRINIDPPATSGKPSILDLLQGGNYKQRRYDQLNARRSELTREENEEFFKLQKDLGIDPAAFLFEDPADKYQN